MTRYSQSLDPSPFRLVVADLDGTLIGEDGILSPATMKAVTALHDAGIRFTIATGRTFAGASRYATALKVNAPIILYQGGEIREFPSGAVLWSQAIPLPLAHEFIHFARERCLSINAYVDDRTYTEKESSETSYYAQLGGVPVQPVGDLLAFLRRPPAKLLVIAEPETVDRIAPGFEERFEGRLGIVRSHRRFLEATPLGVHKGTGVGWLTGHMGIQREAVAAIGDNDNDAEMVAWAGLGIAMGNASPAVKAVADVIAPPLSEDGAAWGIFHCVLGYDGTAQEHT